MGSLSLTHGISDVGGMGQGSNSVGGEATAGGPVSMGHQQLDASTALHNSPSCGPLGKLITHPYIDSHSAPGYLLSGLLRRATFEATVGAECVCAGSSEHP